MNVCWFVCFALVVLTINLAECKGGGGGGRAFSSGVRGSGGRASLGRSSSTSSRGSVSSDSSHNSLGSSGGSSWGSSDSRSSHGSHGSSSGSSRGSSSSGSRHTYPKSSSYSGHGTGGSHSYPSSKGFSRTGTRSRSTYYHMPSYYSSPQHVYVTQYKNSNSRYSDILTGLTLYNLGRFHSHHDHYYYHDSYFIRSTVTGNHDSGNAFNDPNKDEVTCILKMKRYAQEELVIVPCAIVSTFSIGNSIPSSVIQNNAKNCSRLKNSLWHRLDENNLLNKNYAISCDIGTTIVEDPLSVKGAPIDAANMECSVEIRNKKGTIQNNMDCEILLKYAKIPVPEKKVTGVLPRREELKAMLSKPPWWLSFFIAA